MHSPASNVLKVKIFTRDQEYHRRIKTVSEEIASPTEIQVFWMKEFAYG